MDRGPDREPDGNDIGAGVRWTFAARGDDD